MHFFLSISLRLELLQLHENEVQSVNHLIGVLVVDEVIIVIVVVHVVHKILVDEVQWKSRACLTPEGKRR